MRATLDCEFLMQINADLDDPQVLSDTPFGTRRAAEKERQPPI